MRRTYDAISVGLSLINRALHAVQFTAEMDEEKVEVRMNRKRSLIVCLVTITTSTMLAAYASADDRPNAVGLVREVRLATQGFRNVDAALGAGYASTQACVSGPEKGAMGIHFANGPLIEDGLLDAKSPELLIYEFRNGRMRLLGVEFLVIAEAWHAHSEAPPVLMGQQFLYVGSPNRYGLPPFYELHVWAWKDNPSGMFVDWNPTVSCEEFSPDDDTSSPHGHH